MSSIVLVALITAIPPTLAVLVTWYKLHLSQREIKKDLVDIGHDTNSSMTAARQEIKELRQYIDERWPSNGPKNLPEAH